LSDAFSIIEIEEIVNADFTLVGLAASSVALVVGMQTGSWIMAIVGVLSVGWSYPCGLVLYHGILGIVISPQLNLLVSLHGLLCAQAILFASDDDK